MLTRYLKVRGKPCVLVESADTQPTPAGARRYVGQRELATPPPHASYPERFEPIEQVVRDDPDGHLRRAIADGDLVFLGKCVAPTMAEAIAQLAAKTPEAKSAK